MDPKPKVVGYKGRVIELPSGDIDFEWTHEIISSD
jgi:hypothetical protein